MPDDPKRLQALDAMVTILAGITTPTYHTDLSGTEQVTQIMRTRDQMVSQPFKFFVWVHDGFENARVFEATEPRFMNTFQINLALFVFDSSADALVAEMNKLIGDVRLRVGQNRMLNSTVNDSYVAQVTAPSYSVEELEASALVVVRTEYEILASSEI